MSGQSELLSDPYGINLDSSFNVRPNITDRARMLSSAVGQAAMNAAKFGHNYDLTYGEARESVVAKWNDMASTIARARRHEEQWAADERDYHAADAEGRQKAEQLVASGQLTQERLAEVAAERNADQVAHVTKAAYRAIITMSGAIDSVSRDAADILYASQKAPQVFGDKRQAARARDVYYRALATFEVPVAKLSRVRRFINLITRRHEQPLVTALTHETVDQLRTVLEDLPEASASRAIVTRALLGRIRDTAFLYAFGEISPLAWRGHVAESYVQQHMPQALATIRYCFGGHGLHFGSEQETVDWGRALERQILAYAALNRERATDPTWLSRVMRRRPY